MGRLGVVTAPGGRSWRVYAPPVAVLLAVTILVGVLRGGLGGHSAAPPAPPAASKHARAALRPPRPRHVIYVVRAGDTIAAIALRARIPQARILSLNPQVSPTALFIGEKLRLR